MVDVISGNGWFNPALAPMELSQMELKLAHFWLCAFGMFQFYGQ